MKTTKATGDIDALIRQAADLLRTTDYAIALTGAGISTPSGIPDFRSPTSGLWDHANPLEVASLLGFRARPQAFYDWIRPLAHLVLEAKPNPAHLALSRLEEIGRMRAVVTQNIDMLHTRAGSQIVYEVHGHLREATCIKCYREFPAEPFIRAFIKDGTIPRCPVCNGILKPNVILFGEQLPVTAINGAQQAAAQCTTMLVAGSSLEVAPVCDLPSQAHANGAAIIIVNFEPTPADSLARIVIRGDVAEVLPRIVEAVERT